MIFFIWSWMSLHIICLLRLRALNIHKIVVKDIFMTRNAGKYLCGQYLGCRVSTQCLDPILELRLLTDFLGLESSPSPASVLLPSSLTSFGLRSLLIRFTANITLGCSSSQARHIFQIKEFGDRTLETCLNKKHNKSRVNGSLLKLEFFS